MFKMPSGQPPVKSKEVKNDCGGWVSICIANLPALNAGAMGSACAAGGVKVGVAAGRLTQALSNNAAVKHIKLKRFMRWLGFNALRV